MTSGSVGRHDNLNVDNNKENLIEKNSFKNYSFFSTRCSLPFASPFSLHFIVACALLLDVNLNAAEDLKLSVTAYIAFLFACSVLSAQNLHLQPAPHASKTNSRHFLSRPCNFWSSLRAAVQRKDVGSACYAP